MKHSLSITLILTGIFFISQITGLIITNQYIDHIKTSPEAREAGNITWQTLPYEIERPEVEQSNSYLFIIFAIFIGTGLLLLLIKFKIIKLWKFWFFLSVWACLTIAFKAFIPQNISLGLGFILAYLKIKRPSIILHNLTEVFIYGGLAAIFVPIMNFFSAVMLLLLISAYDAWAVWYSKHMITLAKFQSKANMFAGLYVPYSIPKFKQMLHNNNKLNQKPRKSLVRDAQTTQSAILGGGDIGFPLIFTGVVMKQLGFVNVLPITIITTLSLLMLFMLAKKDRFYPAMPFLSLGCFIGYGIVRVIGIN